MLTQITVKSHFRRLGQLNGFYEKRSNGKSAIKNAGRCRVTVGTFSIAPKELLLLPSAEFQPENELYRLTSGSPSGQSIYVISSCVLASRRGSPIASPPPVLVGHCFPFSSTVVTLFRPSPSLPYPVGILLSVSRPEKAGSFSVGRGASPSRSDAPKSDVEGFLELNNASTLGEGDEGRGLGGEVMTVGDAVSIFEGEEGRGEAGEVARRVMQRFEDRRERFG